MTSRTRRSRDGANTRKLILDATEAIMREEGYAAVSSRRVAERAGLASPLIHYHFGTMDDLFLALYRRTEERFLDRQQAALASANPAMALWKLSVEPNSEFVSEFIALAIHRPAVREEIARSNDRARAAQTAALAQALGEAGVGSEDLPADVLAFLIAAASRTLVTECALGASLGHDAARAFIERSLARLGEQRSEVAPST